MDSKNCWVKQQMIPVKTLKSGLSMPVLGLGTWLMGGDINKISGDQDNQDIQAIRAAIELGYTHFDTAEIYGAGYTEEILGQAIAPYDRSKLFIASKATKGHHTSELFEKSLDQSLLRLNTPYLDLYYLHQRTPETPLAETAAAFNKAIKSGKIKNIGVCNFTPQSFDELQQHLDYPIIANQVHYNLAFREPELAGVFEHAAAHDYFVIAWRPLRLRKRNINDPAVTGNVWERGQFPLLDEMATRYQKTNVQIALNWTTRHPNALTLIKSSNPENLKEALGAFDFYLHILDYVKIKEGFSPQFPISDTVLLG